MDRPLLAAVLLVKDEAHTIRKTIASLKGAVDACFLLCTGETAKAAYNDPTTAVAREEAQKIDLPFFFRHGPASDYAAMRNAARVLAETDILPQPPRYTISLSADETLHGDTRAFLATYEGPEDVFLIEIRTPTGSFPYPRILKTESPWRYEGAIHEEPRHQDDPSKRPTITIPGCWIEYAPSDPVRHARRLRERDLPLLGKQLREAKTPEARGRTLVLLARTREHLATIAQDHKDKDGAAQEWFSALGFYAVAMMDETLDEATRAHANFKFLNVAEAIGIYKSSEMIPRIAPLAEASPKDPALAYMLAAHVAACSPKDGLQAAYRAARVAKDAVTDPEHPHDPHGLLWRGHLLAAACAKALGHGPAMKKSAEAGITAGGPEEAFVPFLDDKTGRKTS